MGIAPLVSVYSLEKYDGDLFVSTREGEEVRYGHKKA